MSPPDDSSAGETAPDRARTVDAEIRAAERKLALIRGKQKEFREWERSRRPIRIGFYIVIPIVLAIEGVHLYRTLDRTQGAERAPWLMVVSTLLIVLLSFWYYRQARAQRDRVFRGHRRAALYADDLERKVEDLKRERERLPGVKGDFDPLI